MKDFTMDPVSAVSNDVRWCVNWRNKYIFPFFALAFFIIPFNDISAQKTTAENIQGIAPVITPPGGFEIDGNAYAESAGDWESDEENESAGLFLSTLAPEDFDTGTPQFLFDPEYRDMSFFYRDGITNNDPTIFTSSNKIDDDPETYTWGAGSSPNKNEIQTAAVHFTYGDPAQPGGDSDDLWVIFAADRQVTNGSSYIDFEFLQNSLTRTGLEAGSGGFISDGEDGGRTLGDLLVTVEFTQGGAAAKVVIREWILEDGEYFYREFSTYGPNTIYGTVNTEPTLVPWPVYFTEPVSDGLYQYEINQWAEGAVNLSYYFGNDNPCFNISTMFVRTRTSGSSGTSELKDFPRLEQLTLDLRQDITVTDPDPVCSPTTVDLTAEGIVSGCSGTLSYWMNAEATVAVENPEAVGDGTYYIKCTSNDNDECFDIEPVNVTVDTTPDITVTDPDPVCSPETVDITDAASGCGDGFTLSYWLDEAATQSLATPSAISESGTYYIKCTNNDNADCFEIEPIAVVISETPDISVINPDPVCTPGAVDITDVSNGCGEGFSLSYWMDEDATISLETPSAVAESGTYYIKCTNDSNEDCYDIEAVVVTVDETPDITVMNPDTVCAPDTVDITDAASGCGDGFTLSYWLDEDATQSLGTPSAISESGTYYIKCTNNNNEECFEIEAVVVTISDTPDITVTDPEPACSPDTVDITDAASGCGEGYSLTYWYNAEATDEILDPSSMGEGTYYIKCTNDLNAECFEIESVNVTVDETPSISITNPDPVCDPGTVDLTADGIVIGCTGTLSYWTDLGATTQIPDPTSVGGGIFYIKCTNDDNENCYDIQQVVVTVNDVPDISVINPDPVCSPGTVDITGAASGCGEDSTISYWTDSGATIALANPSAVAVSGTYYIKCTSNENSDCFDIEAVVVTIDQTPDITVMDPAPVCAPETIDITGVASGCGDGFTLTYWNDAGATSSLANPSAIAVSGTYYIKCTNNNNAECFDIEPVVVVIEICDDFTGCTLGYWKNHTDRWCDEYSTCDIYGDIFEGAPSQLAGLTLLEVLNLGGGGINNLGRQSVAALLNACSDEVNYELATPADVIAYVIANFNNAGTAGSYLDMLNQRDCPLGGSSATTAPSDECPVTDAGASFDASAGISVSPVPFRDNLNIKYEFDYESDATIQIFDLRGNMVKTFRESNAGLGKVTTISTEFVRGEQMYIVKVTTDRGTYTKNVVSGGR